MLELSQKVAAIRLSQQSHDANDSTSKAIKCATKGIGFKEKDGKKMKKHKRLKSWVDQLKQKRRKVKPSQTSLHKVNFSASYFVSCIV